MTTTQTYVVPTTMTIGNGSMCNGTMNETFCNFTLTTESRYFFTDYEPIIRNLWLIPGIIILIIGTIGHTLTFAVIASSRYLRQLSSSIYLVAMSIAGILALYTGLIRYIIFIGISNFQLDFREGSVEICKFHMSITYFSLQYFAWLQATISVDRLICVLKPHRYRLSCKWAAALIISIIEFVLVLAINGIVMDQAALNERGHCVFGDREFYTNTWVYIDLASFSIIPASIMVICNTVILIVLRQLKSRLGGAGSDNMSRSLTIMLMTLNLTFLITTLPISVVSFIDWGEYGTIQWASYEVCWAVFSLLQYLGAASTFLIYCFTGPQFREEMWALFGCSKHCRKKITSRTSKSETKTRNGSPEHSQTQLTAFRGSYHSVRNSGTMSQKNSMELSPPNNNFVTTKHMNGSAMHTNGSMSHPNGVNTSMNGSVIRVEEFDAGDHLNGVVQTSPSRDKLITERETVLTEVD